MKKHLIRLVSMTSLCLLGAAAWAADLLEREAT